MRSAVLTERLLKKRGHMSGDDQSDALAARDAQAWAVLEAGDPARAADLFEALLAELRDRKSVV